MNNVPDSMQLREVKKELTEPEGDVFEATGDFCATFNASGIYSPTQFVVRLSPKIHEHVDAFGAFDFEGRDPDDLFSAYSTFLHETIHNAAIRIMPRAAEKVRLAA